MEFIEAKISDISLTNVGFAVFLKAKDDLDSRVVPIFIGPLEAHSITSVLEHGKKPPRPMTHDLITEVFAKFQLIIQKITIDDIIDNTFYAKIFIKNNSNNELLTLDARPSDSISLALRAKAPIFLSKKVFNEAGIEFNAEEFTKEPASQDELGYVLPKSQIDELKESLNQAVKIEDYEKAAELRDLINGLEQTSQS